MKKLETVIKKRFKKKINLLSLVDETGIKRYNEFYRCSRCTCQETETKKVRDRWMYKITLSETDLLKFKGESMGYAPLEKVKFLCPKHFEIEGVPEGFVEVGLPYFLSINITNKGIFSF